MNYKYVRIIFASVYTLCVFVFLAFFYWGHISDAEFSRMFLFTGDYFVSAISRIGGFGIYILDFLIQFFHYPVLGAAIVSLLLLLDSILLSKRCRSVSTISFMMSFLPATAVVVFIALFSSTNALSTLLPAMVLLGSLAAANLVAGKSSVLCAALTPVVFYLIGPLSWTYVFALLNNTKARSFIYSLAAYLICLVLSYFIFTHYLIITLFDIQLLLDVRFTHDILPRTIPVAVSILVLLLPSFEENPPRIFIYTTVLFCLGALVAGIVLAQRTKIERVLRYKTMMVAEDWDGILKLASKHKMSVFEECCCVDLALAKKGILAQELFNYPQGGPMAMVPSYSTSISPFYPACIMKHVTLFTIAQRYVFEYQVGGTTCETNARCFKMLAELNAAVGHAAVAQKFADGLSHTLFYRKWAKDFDASEKLPCVSDSLDLNLFYVEGQFADAIAYCLKRNPDFDFAREYMLCWYILAKDLKSFADTFDPSRYDTIPELYLDAYTLHWAQGHDDFSGMPEFVPQSKIAEIVKFSQMRSKGKEAVKKHYGKTCWYYMFYVNPTEQ